MTIDRDLVISNRGTLTFTPASAAGGGAIGFTVDGVTIRAPMGYSPVMSDEAGEAPINYIFLGGPVFVEGVAQQWDAATKAALGAHMISNDDFIFATQNVGALASVLAAGSLVFTADDVGSLQLQATIAVPLSGRESNLRIGLRKKKVTTFPFVFGCLPDYSLSSPTGRQLRVYPKAS